jgi:hypothetical protein
MPTTKPGAAKTADALGKCFSRSGAEGVIATAMHIAMQQLFPAILSWSDELDGAVWQWPAFVICM